MLHFNKETGALEWTAEDIHLAQKMIASGIGEVSTYAQWYIGDKSYNVEEGGLTLKQLAADICGYCRECTPVTDHGPGEDCLYPLYLSYHNGKGPAFCRLLPQRPLDNREVFSCDLGFGLRTASRTARLSGPELKRRRTEETYSHSLQRGSVFSFFFSFSFHI